LRDRIWPFGARRAGADPGRRAHRQPGGCTGPTARTPPAGQHYRTTEIRYEWKGPSGMAARRRKQPAMRSTSSRRKRRKANGDRPEAARRIARGRPDGLCWRICKWRALYAMETQPGSDAEKYSLMYPMQYVKLWCGQSTAEGIFVDLQLAAIRAAGGLELLGIALQLLRMAACRDRFGGRLVDHLGHVASLREIALEFGVSTRRMQAALKTLSGH